jgi:dihydrofolate reductase
MNLIHIVAHDQNRLIGVDNKIPWRLKDDLKRFKKLTMGCPMIMGRKTFDSLPGILPGRLHVVLTRKDVFNYNNEDFTINDSGITIIEPDKLCVFKNAEDVLAYFSQEPTVFVIGGGQIYKLFFKSLTHAYVTEVARKIPLKKGQALALCPDYSNLKASESSLVFDGEGFLSHKYIDYEKE